MYFSVVIPTFNRNDLVIRAIKSVLDQDYFNFEIIVIDDCSDEIFQLPYELSQFPIQIIRNTSNKGVSFSRNIGIQNSKYDLIAFLDSDDEWLESKLLMQSSFLKQNKDTLIVHGNEIWKANGIHKNQHSKHKKYGGHIFEKCLPICLMSPSSIVIHKSVFTHLGGFNETLPVCEDYEMWLKISLNYKIGFIESPIIIKHGGHQNQLSHQFHSMDYYRVLSLDRIKNDYTLNENQLSLVNSEIVKKSKILINGYKKHNNLTNILEVSNILNKAYN